MPIEDIKTAKAPAGWRPTLDQQRRINSDPRLQRMSRDDQYFFFQQRPRDAERRGTPAPTPAPQNNSGFFGGIFDYIAETLRGANR